MASDPMPAGNPTAGPDVSLIVPVFRDADLVLACLQSVVDDPSARGVDLVVVDDQSQDDTPDRIEAAHLPGVRLIRRARNGGFARACMEGWRHRDAARRYVGVLNADTQIVPGWLAACVARLEQDSRCGCVVPSVVRFDDPDVLDSAGQCYAACGWGYRRGHGAAVDDYDTLAEVFAPTGCAMIARSDAIEAAGGLFREDLECYYEDTELGFRLHRAGWTCLHEPAARVRHHVSATYDRIPRRRAYFVSRNSTLLFFTGVPRRSWWWTIPQRALLSSLLAVKALRHRCLIPFLRGRLEAWPMILRGPSLRSQSATRAFSRGWWREVRRVNRGR